MQLDQFDRLAALVEDLECGEAHVIRVAPRAEDVHPEVLAARGCREDAEWLRRGAAAVVHRVGARAAANAADAADADADAPFRCARGHLRDAVGRGTKAAAAATAPKGCRRGSRREERVTRRASAEAASRARCAPNVLRRRCAA